MQNPINAQQLVAQYGALPIPQQAAALNPQMVVVPPTVANAAAAAPAAVGAVPSVAVGANVVRPALPVPHVGAKTKKRKFGQERQAAPEKVSTAIPESALYNQLLDMDRHVTDIINRRKADFREPFPPYHEPVKRVLRIAVQASYSHQPAPPKPPPAPAPGLPSNAAALAAASSAMFARAPSATPTDPEPPSWVLHISAHLVDPAEQLVRAALAAAAAAAARGDPSSAALVLQAQQLAAQHAAQQAAAAAAGTAKQNTLTSVVRRVEVQLDPEQYPGESGRMVWEKGNHTGPPRDVLEVRRQGSRSCRAVVLLDPDYQPERYVLPPLLAEVLGMMPHETRSRVMVALYGFIKSRRLQDPKNPINVNLTPELAQVFGVRTLKLSELGGRLSALLAPVPPVRLEYDIKLDALRPPPTPHSSSSAAPPSTVSGVCEVAVLDVDFFTPSPLPHQMGAVLQSYYKDKEIEAMDARLHSLIRRLNECRRRRALLQGFAQHPIDTTHALLAAQARDVRLARQGSGRDYEVERRTEVFRQRWVEDAVVNYLHKRLGRPE
ncbi:hypothetical protein Agub_g5715, partial [Astrephomene gubernaculifera]